MVVVKRVSVARILRDCWKNLRDHFGHSKHLKNTDYESSQMFAL